MKDVVWLIQDSGLEFGIVDKVIDALKAENIPYHTVGLRPFDNKFHGLEDLNLEDKVVIPYGSTRFVQLAQLMGLTVYHDPATFHLQTWRSKIRAKPLFNYELWVCPLDELKHSITHLKSRFIRPLTDFKVFPGQVVEFSEDIQNIIDKYNLRPGTLCAHSPVKDIYQEARIFVVDGRFVSASQYRLEGKLDLKSLDLKLFYNVKYIWTPHEACVLDVVKQSKDDYWRVLEFNTFNCSGFYDHDVRAVVRAVTDHERNKK